MVNNEFDVFSIAEFIQHRFQKVVHMNPKLILSISSSGVSPHRRHHTGSGRLCLLTAAEHQHTP